MKLTHPTNRPNFCQYEDDHGLTVWFSYETPIVFHTEQTGYVIRENDWGPTTARHYSAALPPALARDKSLRIPGYRFAAALAAVTR